MKKFIVTGICALALGLAAPIVSVSQTLESDLMHNVETVALFRKKDKKKENVETQENAPANAPLPEKTTPAPTQAPESNKGTQFVEIADINRPFYRKHNYVPETNDNRNNNEGGQPVTIPAEINPQNPQEPSTSPANVPPSSVPATVPNTNPNNQTSLIA